MYKILIVEDNKDVNKMLAEVLNEEGYQVCSVYTGIDGLKEISEGEYDLILLDIMLPYKSGDEILKEVRKFSDVPVIIISAKDITGTKIELLKMGADDYITKPFDLGEAVARVQTCLRRFKKLEEKVYKYKDMVVDINSKHITVNNIELELTAKEYLIIEQLIKNRNKVFTKANLYEIIWQDAYLGDDNAVKTHMSNLRSKLKIANPDNEYIETVWGLGYRLYKE
ncbi:response regulator transcription factor [Pseudobacteroides cellulosolvens]|uniref:Stage 0 sporulation protein A homolog n=1 Tax=Pseudobacteroides cellulosolvens ATCC 35603 = DSM 2933 TaxID=398512 RepID=A0A0L6JJT2_9FIRM|nr:response regulator transcription factor [Pseudobacteroides cellulosolvens]KNY25963.1 two component transcriptional regulator, winged helix family [Pseudobacteroides cellulosolvens ATCC 35603 = DSM 2933]